MHSAAKGTKMRVAHFRLIQDNNQCYIHDKSGSEKRFPSLNTLIQYYRHHDTHEKGGLPAQLVSAHPFTKTSS